MDSLCRPRLLLVGEGNFSFSVNLCQQRGYESHIIATCYESEDTVFRQALIKSNVQYLRDRGAEVHFSVDCTKLEEHFSPDERDFDCIYFNFPHCGRKAGVKKNRELLARFFRSCAEVLAEKGEIHVALCRGQGGTPADKPMREWQNSWQIVAMAAEAGFILSHVDPFNTGDSCGYKCTGYRSQDKSFHLEGALNHIFTWSLPFPNPKPVMCQTELEGTLVSFVVPEIFLDKINRGFLDVNSEHPVRKINEKLIGELGKSFPVQKMNSSLLMVFQGGHDMLPSPEVFWTVPVTKRKLNPKSMLNETDKNPGAFGFPSGWDNLCEHIQERDWISGQFYLRPSILACLHTAVQQQEFPLGTFLFLSGVVFRKSKISAYSLPIFHETAFICRINRDFEDRWLQGLTGSLIRVLNSLCPSSDFKLHCIADEPETAQLNTFVAVEPQLFKAKYLITVTFDTSAPGPKVLSVGRVGMLPRESTSIDQETVYVSLNLDLLAMYICGILDWRILWTSDKRFQNQFMGGHLGPFKNFSLYPPSYVHDISFWVPEPEKFDENQLHTIARSVSCGTIVSLQLLDSFQHPDTVQTSFCYRFTYQSCDRALTRQQVAEMQAKLRNELQHSLPVILR